MSLSATILSFIDLSIALTDTRLSGILSGRGEVDWKRLWRGDLGQPRRLILNLIL
jgi:hypothetical protein